MIEQFREWLPVAKDLAQIFALIGVGFWTLFVYLRSEAPSLGGQIAVASSLTFVNLEGERSEVVFSVSVQNNGRTAFRIEEVLIRVWRMEFDPSILAQIAPTEILRSQPSLVQRAVTAGALVRIQGPGEGSTDTFFAMLPGMIGQRVLFDARIKGSVLGLIWNTQKVVNSYRWVRLSPAQTLPPNQAPSPTLSS